MLHVAIVEDEAETARAMEEYLARFGREKQIILETEHFLQAESFLQVYTSRFDLVLLDIRLEGGMSGMEAAQELRKRDDTVQIVFVTNLARYAVKSYEVGALDFVLKPVTYAQFAMKMERVMRVLPLRADVRLSVPTPRGLKILTSREITFLEVSDHELVYHTLSGEYRTRGSLGKAEEQLKGLGFLRTAVSHLANLRYASEIDATMLVLTTGDRLPISRARRKEVLAGLARYLGGSI